MNEDHNGFYLRCFSINPFFEILRCDELSSRNAASQRVGNSASEITGRNVEFSGGYFVSWVQGDVVLYALGTGKLL